MPNNFPVDETASNAISGTPEDRTVLQIAVFAGPDRRKLRHSWPVSPRRKGSAGKILHRADRHPRAPTTRHASCCFDVVEATGTERVVIKVAATTDGTVIKDLGPARKREGMSCQEEMEPDRMVLDR